MKYALKGRNTEKQLMEWERIEDINFPKSEIESLRPRNTIVTHRVLDDARKYVKGDFVFAEQIDQNYCFEIVDQETISNVEDSPYFSELTTAQRTYLSKFDEISVLTLKKTKYERPYKLSTIKDKYPEVVYKKLVSDQCHVWRARTGIDMIHLEPDDAEQERTCKNWRLMSERYRKISDKKSMELFGWDNLSHEKELPVDRIRKIFSQITYGLRDPKTNKPWRDTHKNTTFADYDEAWRLGSPLDTITAKTGNCYDTVAISREILSAAGIRFRIFFMTTADSVFDGIHFTEAPTHTFLIYQSKADNKWRWLEGSWGPFRNNTWKSSNPSDLINWIATAMANTEKKDIVVHELRSYPKYGCDMTEFERFCRQGNKVGVFHSTSVVSRKS
jgi:hypothetical protein